MDAYSLRQALSGQIGRTIPDLRYAAEIGSTNDAALAWIEAGAPDGCLVVADRQTAGRGRLGRRWVTNPGAALAFSLVIRPNAGEMERLGMFSPLGGLAVAVALERSLGLQPQIKWPNDVLVNGRKLCGILLEAAWQGADLRGIVIGIGVNVARAAVPPPEEVLFPATSLEDALGRAPDREALLADILAALFEWRLQLGAPVFLQAWQERLAFVGKWVRVEQTGRPALVGRVLGVAPGGDLRLRTAAGEEQSVSVGDVHLRPSEPDQT